VRFRENVNFGPFSWVTAHDFTTLVIFFNIPDVHIFIDFWTVRYTFRAFFGLFSCLWNRDLRAQTDVRMMHFVTLAVSPPHTDHSLMHNSTTGMSPGQKSLLVRFRENVRFGPFSWVITHNFQQSGQFFLQHPGCAQSPCRRHFARFSLFFEP
jgi:hypothetical protein